MNRLYRKRTKYAFISGDHIFVRSHIFVVVRSLFVCSLLWSVSMFCILEHVDCTQLSRFAKSIISRYSPVILWQFRHIYLPRPDQIVVLLCLAHRPSGLWSRLKCVSKDFDIILVELRCFLSEVLISLKILANSGFYI